MGGQVDLNCVLDLNRHGVLDQYNVEMIGATSQAIDKAEDREQFRIAMKSIHLDMVNGDLGMIFPTSTVRSIQIAHNPINMRGW